MSSWLSSFINDRLTVFVIRLVFAAVVLIIGTGISKKLTGKLKSSRVLSSADENLCAFIISIISLVAESITVLVSVAVLGVPASTVAAIIAVIGLITAFTIKGGLNNIAGGIVIILSKPFRTGDYIICDGNEGIVSHIGIYYTKLTTPDNRDIFIPNSIISGSTVENLSTEEKRRLDFDFRVHYNTDIDLARKVLLATASMNDLILKEPSPVVIVSAHGENGLVLKLRVWTQTADADIVSSDMWEDVKKAFDKFSIEIPHM